MLATGCVTPNIQPAVFSPDDPVFRARLDQLARAFESMNPNDVVRFYAQDTYSVSFDLPYAFDPTGEDHLRTLTRFFATLRSIRLQPGASIEVWTTGDKAWTTRSYKANGVLKNGATFQFDGWHSAIWEKRNGDWVIAYEHFGGPEAKLATTAPPPSPAPQAAPPAAPQPRFADIFFDYDKWDIRPDQKVNLAANAELLRANPALEVTIEGYCDERGTFEYNIQLGQKRADAVREYLIKTGVAATRLKPVSLGKGRTFARGRGEPAWGLNRRAHFVIRKK
jgi:peptidoglycan-associated lipoprotein